MGARRRKVSRDDSPVVWGERARLSAVHQWLGRWRDARRRVSDLSGGGGWARGRAEATRETARDDRKIEYVFYAVITGICRK